MPAHKINPKARRNAVTIRLPQYLIDYCDAVVMVNSGIGCRADIIESAMVEHYNLTPPDRNIIKAVDDTD